MSIGRAALKRVCNKPVGPVGYGMLSLSLPWSPVEQDAAVGLLKKALEQGSNLWNSATYYGTPTANSLHLLRYYFNKYPEDADKVVLSIKGAYGHATGPVGSPEGIRESVEEALKILEGTKAIDVFELGRVDLNTPIETSMKALADLVKEGKIGGVGLSEVSADTIRKAHAVYPISAVEIELSLFTPDPLKNGIMDTCQELSIPVLAYCPIGRGWLAGKYRTVDDLPKDIRGTFPRLMPESFDQNTKLVNAVEKVADRKGLATSQVAIAWVTRQGAIPIPGSSNSDRIALNSKVADLTEEDMEELQEAMDTFPVAGERYPSVHAKFLNA